MQRPMVRQGDVLLIPVATLPAGAAQKPRDQGRVVLAYGEVTGHAHVVQSDAEAVEAFLADHNGQTFLSAPAGSRVVHEEHDAIPLEGVYRVVRQREWTDDDEPRQVAD